MRSSPSIASMFIGGRTLTRGLFVLNLFSFQEPVFIWERDCVHHICSQHVHANCECHEATNQCSPDINNSFWTTLVHSIKPSPQLSNLPNQFGRELLLQDWDGRAHLHTPPLLLDAHGIGNPVSCVYAVATASKLLMLPTSRIVLAFRVLPSRTSMIMSVESMRLQFSILNIPMQLSLSPPSVLVKFWSMKMSVAGWPSFLMSLTLCKTLLFPARPPVWLHVHGADSAV
jgi:hypothetical protein